MRKVYHVILTTDERAALQTLITQGTAAARALTRARILLKADASPAGPAWSDARIVAALDVSRPTVARVRQRFGTERIAAVQRHPPTTRPAPKVDGDQEAHLIALACSPPPSGRGRWSLRLLAARYVVLGYGEPISHEWVRQTLKKPSQTVAEAEVGHSAQSERRLCLPDGGCARALPASLRPAPSAGLHG